MPEVKPKRAVCDLALQLGPIKLSRTAWYYEEPRGITVVQEARTSDDEHIQTVTSTITWRKLAASLRRKNRRKRKP